MLKHLDAALEEVRKPIGTANGLPNDFYTDAGTFADEREAVLFANWSAIGFASDIAGPGDAMPVDFAGMPLFAVRDREGTVRVFQNTCRHRGMILLEEKRTITGAIRCPYHSWSYALDGELRATPHVGGPGHNVHSDICREALGLIEIRSHIWRDVIFVNVSGDAPPFEEYASDIIGRWREFDRPLFHGGADSAFQLEVNCNWKLAVENYCESYHLPWVHPGLNSYSRLEDHYHIEVPGRYSGQGTHVYRPMIDESGSRFADFEGLDAKWDSAAEYIALYPNVLFGVHRDHAFAIILQPLTHERTMEHVALYYANPEMASEERKALREANSRMWRDVFEEDIFVVEGMQRGRHGVKFDGGRFSPVMDGPTHLFHAWVADQFVAPRHGG